MTTVTFSITDDRIIRQYSSQELQKKFEDFLFQMELEKNLEEAKETPDSDFVDL